MHKTNRHANIKPSMTQFGCLVVWFVAASLALRADTISAADGVVFESCTIGNIGMQLPAQCATVAVPMNPELPDNGTLELSVARIQSRRATGNTDAVTLIAGGPGQSAIESYPALAFAFRHIVRERDLILIDQRGTGQSSPLECPSQDDAATFDTALERQVDLQELAQSASDCLASLDADTTLFTTSVAVRDLENVRRQLGISQWNLYGVSYGTRVAAHYLRRYPDAVRSMIVDAVLPPTVTLGPDIARMAQNALEHIYARCEAEAGCNNAFGNLTDATLAFIERLKANPRSITYEDIVTGQLTTREMTAEQLAATLRLLSYSSQTAAILPSMIHEAIANDNLAPLARQGDMQNSTLSSTLATGMHHAVICTEDVPFFDSVQPAPDAPPASASYLGTEIKDVLEATCSRWPAGIIDEDFRQPLFSDKPVLILSGGADPITPPSYGDELAATLGNAKHIVNEAEGHMQAPFGCIPLIMAQFISLADIEGLQTDCLERLQPTPFFIDANGPLP